jgi:hypothetical protein
MAPVLAAKAAATKPVALSNDAKTGTLKTSILKGQEERAERELAAMAPADEYFGPLKLSLIGISNTIRDLGLRYDYNHDIPRQTFASTQLVESAVRDWQHRYPHDPQLPRSVYRLQRLYTKILLQESRDRAAVIAKFLFANFGSSPQARQLKKTLALEHLAPLASPTPVASPTPSPQDTASPGDGSLVQPSAAPSVAPGAEPAPMPSQDASPLPSQDASPMPSTTVPAAGETPEAATPLPAPPESASPAPAPASPIPAATTAANET